MATVSTLKTYLTEADINRLFMAADTLRNKLIIRLLYHLGCRVSELVTIKCSDIDFRKRLILIRHLKKVVRRVCEDCGAKVGRSHNYCPKCGAVLKGNISEERVWQRLIPFDGETASLIKKYLEKRRIKDKRLVPLTRQMVFYIVRNTARRAGLGGKVLLNPETGRSKGVSPHRFRDAMALRWLEKRGDLEGMKALQEFLGHKDYSTTARYLKLSPRDVKNIYDEVFEE